MMDSFLIVPDVLIDIKNKTGREVLQEKGNSEYS